MDGPFEVDSRGKEHSEHDPRYYVITDRFGREICDTLNCHHTFTTEEQKAHLEELAAALNREMAGPIPSDKPVQYYRDGLESIAQAAKEQASLTWIIGEAESRLRGEEYVELPTFRTGAHP